MFFLAYKTKWQCQVKAQPNTLFSSITSRSSFMFPLLRKKKLASRFFVAETKFLCQVPTKNYLQNMSSDVRKKIDLFSVAHEDKNSLRSYIFNWINCVLPLTFCFMCFIQFVCRRICQWVVLPLIFCFNCLIQFIVDMLSMDCSCFWL